jgi:cyanophycin synthetase
MTNTDGVYVERRRIDTGDCSGPKSARNVLMHPDVDAAVFETARGGMLREGLASTAARWPWSPTSAAATTSA